MLTVPKLGKVGVQGQIWKSYRNNIRRYSPTPLSMHESGEEITICVKCMAPERVREVKGGKDANKRP